MKIYLKYLAIGTILALGIGQWIAGEKVTRTYFKYQQPSEPDLGMLRIGGSVSDVQVQSSLKVYETKLETYNKLTPEQKSETITVTSGSAFLPRWTSISLVILGVFLTFVFGLLDIFRGS